MIRKYAFLLFVASFIVRLQASDAQSLFMQANQFYQKGNYEQAVQLYDSILVSGLESGALYFNLGNAYYKMGNLGLARLNYERAARLLKNDPALKENLDLLKMRLVDKIQTPPRFILSAWNDSLLDWFGMKTLSWIVAGLLWIFLLLAAVRQYFVKRGKGDRYKALMITALVLLVFFSLLLAQKIYRSETETYGVVLKPSVTLYAEPRSTGTEVFILHEGTKMKIRRQKDEWMEIMLEDGKTGWIEKSYLEII